MLRSALVVLIALVALAAGGVWLLGSGLLARHWDAGTPSEARIPAAVVEERTAAQSAAAAAAEIVEPRQILFGDLHVHSTFSIDAFFMNVPVWGGEGAHPVSDACDFARFCSALDFWSINDHALGLTPRRWRETVESIRQCNAVAAAGGEPDVTAFLGWEWTQIGRTPETHYGHKNVVLRHLDDERIPARPIASTIPTGRVASPNPFRLGLLPVLHPSRAALDTVGYLLENAGVAICESGVPVRELPADCREVASEPRELFAKLDDWGHEALVIPHGTTWGYYTPLGSSWDKQLTREQHDPDRQTLIEVFSGHGNSEEYRSWREAAFDADGRRSCPEPSGGYLPSCWRAGEIVRARCEAAGLPADTCEQREAEARQNYVDADIAGHLTVPGATVTEWLDSGQCPDCFQPSFNHRPRSSVQYILALSGESPEDPRRFRFGFIASSDNHSARPGTGYKEFARTSMTEAGFERLPGTPAGGVADGPTDPEPRSVPFDAASSRRTFFNLRETERQASFFVTGGLVAAHARGRDREAIWDALVRREVYGTSGPRILLWFDLVNGPGDERLPMGGEAGMSDAPTFEVRAVGSFEQEPGCPEWTADGLPADELERLCRGQCYHPSDVRRPITRIEVVRIRPRAAGRAYEPVDDLIEDPWRVYPCESDPAGCRLTFSDETFPEGERDALYYVRAIEAPSPAVNADGLRCARDEEGRCLRADPCLSRPDDDDCLAETEPRAWSSPIYVDFAGS